MGNMDKQSKVFLEFILRKYLEEREFSTVMKCLADDVSWIGTGKQTFCKNIVETVRLFNSERSEWGGHFNINNIYLEEVKLSDTVYLLFGNIDISEDEEIKTVADLKLRLTAVCKYEEQSFNVSHIHLSVPNIEQCENEFFPKVITEQGNRILRERIEEKTKELEKVTEDFFESEARYKFAIEATNDIVFDYNLNTKKVTVDYEKLINIYGLSRKTINLKGIKEAIIEVIHPDDIEVAKCEFFDNHIEIEDFKTTPREYRIKTTKRNYIWVSVTTIPILNKKGELYKIVGHLKNIDLQKKKEIEMRKMSRRDSLTGLWNRSYTEQSINEFLSKDLNYGALMMIDIDNFKGVNDTFGHLYGDKVLVCISDKLRSLFSYDCIDGRVGGDEFVIFIKNINDIKHITEKAASVVDFLRKRIEFRGKKCDISGTVGIAMAPNDGHDFNTLIKNADDALYKVKKNGKNSYLFYNYDK